MWYLFSISFIFGAGIPFAKLTSKIDFAKVSLKFGKNNLPPTDDQGMFSILLNSQANFFVEGLMRGDE